MPSATTAPTEIVSKTVEDGSAPLHLPDAQRRARKLANALKRLGVRMHDRVATLAWNGFRHFEIYYAVAGSGAVIHTINPRLFPDQIAYIANHAEDKDRVLRPDVRAAGREARAAAEGAKGCPMTDRAHMPTSTKLLCYEELIARATSSSGRRSTSAPPRACYTSGTTGNPKGALYSHRSTMLHAYAAALPDALSLSAREVMLPVVPMFHVNAWGLPYTCAMAGRSWCSRARTSTARACTSCSRPRA